ncbi:uncharacterized protein BO97DRAFT_481658 [Aspergillus homomorphus CBS 101889]|uniref:Uncharacterized protein n=1 Tax=Aspergillus homomorphus (strain CBS 101889) TaxID=1450537 RepID=A0A395HG13_ASPHC|nr:hypothetical protein BO97DRAFT_481658 [Aspergillus homomorphus CBS 101889]RAL06871.1 hypothetical protein BO97DRAFT_481658 [Aspergillus homomorphus CBS 101889]
MEVSMGSGRLHPISHGSGTAGNRKPLHTSLHNQILSTDDLGDVQILNITSSHGCVDALQPTNITCPCEEKHQHRHLAIEVPSLDRVLSKSRHRHKHKHSKSIDSRLPRKKSQLVTSTTARGLLPTWPVMKDKENDGETGLLRPITHQTIRSRWRSESTTGLNDGSRRGSLLEGLDTNTKLGPIARQEIQLMGDLEQVRSRRKYGEEYLRSALSLIGTLATDITRRLDYTYYNLLEKVAALNATLSSFQELLSSTSSLFADFERETSSLDQEIRKQIGELKEFQPQFNRIEALESRMKLGRVKAQELNDRLETMRDEIDRWEKKEMDWQDRVNRRLRMFWALVAAGVFAMLLVIAIQNKNTILSPAPPSSMNSATAVVGHSARHDDNHKPKGRNSHTWIKQPTQTTLPQESGNSKPTNDDPLIFLDEL